MIKSLKVKLTEKLSFWKLSNLKKVIKEYGPAFLVILIGWEIAEDILFPALFYVLGEYFPAFYALIPVSWILCLHPIAVPAIFLVYVKISNKNKDLEKVNKNKHLWHNCEHDH